MIAIRLLQDVPLRTMKSQSFWWVVWGVQMAGKKIVKTMTAKEVEKFSRKEGFHAVGGCPSLYLQCQKNSASWILRILVNGRRREIGLGSYALISLDDARRKCMDLRLQVRNGIDPLAEKLRIKQERKITQAKTMTFSECMEAYLSAHEDSWKNPKHRQQWRNTLTAYASPMFGDLPVSEIDTGLVMKSLEPIWKVKTETASRLRGRIEQVLDWAKVRGYRVGENPARWKGHLDKLLPAKQKVSAVVHHPALPYKQIAAFTKELRQLDGFGAFGLEFAILTASRFETVQLATWEEIDFAKGIWICPATHMKLKREHRVPLSKRAIKLLKSLPCINGTDLIFPGGKGNPMSDATMTAPIKRLHDKAIESGGKGWIGS